MKKENFGNSRKCLGQKNLGASDFKIPEFMKGKGYYKFIYTDFDWDRDWQDVRKITEFLRPQFGNDIKMRDFEQEVKSQKELKTFKYAKTFFTELAHKCLKMGAVPNNGKMETI